MKMNTYKGLRSLLSELMHLPHPSIASDAEALASTNKLLLTSQRSSGSRRS